ncbi:hypothetical protein BDW60DRAFT_225393 [Aspergillus nidulans var. acristatus]
MAKGNAVVWPTCIPIILTGTTGFVGTEVLHQALQHPSITSVVVLSRKQLPDSITTDPKVTVKIVDDFLSYPDSLLQDIIGAEACIWTLGLPYHSDLAFYRRVNVDYTLAAVTAFTESLTPGLEKPLRFIYCSGAAAVRDQEKPLWLMPQTRKIRGQVENELLVHAGKNVGKVEVYILRPAMILSKGWSLGWLLFGMTPSIAVDTLSRVMLDLAVNGGRAGRIVENSEMNAWDKT